MSDHGGIESELKELLRAADAAAPPLRLAPPRVADLRRRWQRRVAGASAAALVAAGLAATLLPHGRQGPNAPAGNAPSETSTGEANPQAPGTFALQTASARVERALAAFPLPTARAFVPREDDAAFESMSTSFRVLHRGAERGDEAALADLVWLAETLPETHAGRCALAYLAERDRRTEERPATPTSTETDR
jgi:hypothetical protein